MVVEEGEEVFLEMACVNVLTTDTTTKNNTNQKVSKKKSKVNVPRPDPLLEKIISKVAFIGFEGSAFEITTADGYKFIVRKKDVAEDYKFLFVTLFESVGDSENQKPKKGRGAGRKVKTIDSSRPPTTPTRKPFTHITPPVENEPILPEVVTLDGEDDDEIQVICVIPKQGSNVASKVKPPPPPPKVNTLPFHPKIITFNGSVEVKRGKQGNIQPKYTFRPDVINIDNFSQTEEREAMRCVECLANHIQTVVMDLNEQRDLWNTIRKHRVHPTDPPLNTVLDSPVETDEELIDTCYIIRRAFLVFYTRVEALYKFVFPYLHLDIFPIAVLVLDMWMTFTNQEKEIFYYANSSINVEVFNKIAQFPPGIIERRVFQDLFPNGEIVSPIPAYNDLFAVDFIQRDAAEKKRQADDAKALEESNMFKHNKRPKFC